MRFWIVAGEMDSKGFAYECMCKRDVRGEGLVGVSIPQVLGVMGIRPSMKNKAVAGEACRDLACGKFWVDLDGKETLVNRYPPNRYAHIWIRIQNCQTLGRFE